MLPLKDDRGPLGFPVVTWALTIAWVVVHAGLWLTPEDTRAWIDGLGLDPEFWAARWRGENKELSVDPLLSLWGYALVHGSPVHLLTNGLFFHVFGGRLEQKAGSLRFLIFVVTVVPACGLGLAPMRGYWDGLPWSDEGLQAPLVGASGLVGACIATYLIWFLRATVAMVVPVVVVPLVVRMPAVCVLVSWMVLQFPPVQDFLDCAASTPLPVQGRVVGIAYGLLVGTFLLWPRRHANQKARPKSGARGR